MDARKAQLIKAIPVMRAVRMVAIVDKIAAIFKSNARITQNIVMI